MNFMAALMPMLQAMGFTLTPAQIAAAEELITKRLPELTRSIDAKVGEIDKRLSEIEFQMRRMAAKQDSLDASMSELFAAVASSEMKSL